MDTRLKTSILIYLTALITLNSATGKQHGYRRTIQTNVLNDLYLKLPNISFYYYYNNINFQKLSIRSLLNNLIGNSKWTNYAINYCVAILTDSVISNQSTNHYNDKKSSKLVKIDAMLYFFTRLMLQSMLSTNEIITWFNSKLVALIISNSFPTIASHWAFLFQSIVLCSRQSSIHLYHC